jgi:hypothetical protein
LLYFGHNCSYLSFVTLMLINSAYIANKPDKSAPPAGREAARKG